MVNQTKKNTLYQPRKPADRPDLPDEEVVPVASPDAEHSGRGAPEVFVDPSPIGVLLWAQPQERDPDRGAGNQIMLDKEATVIEFIEKRKKKENHTGS